MKTQEPSFRLTPAPIKYYIVLYPQAMCPTTIFESCHHGRRSIKDPKFEINNFRKVAFAFPRASAIWEWQFCVSLRGNAGAGACRKVMGMEWKQDQGLCPSLSAMHPCQAHPSTQNTEQISKDTESNVYSKWPRFSVRYNLAGCRLTE